MKKRLLLSTILLLFFSLVTQAQTPDDRGYIVKVGDQLDEVELQMIDGTRTSLESLKGQIVILQFTASWCKVCREEMPHIEAEVWQPLKDKGLMVIGVDYDEPLEKVQNSKNRCK